jgi:hypothetical protein
VEAFDPGEGLLRDESLFAVDVAEERPLGDIRRRRDVADGGRLEAALGEQTLGGLPQRSSGGLLVASRRPIGSLTELLGSKLVKCDRLCG